MGTLHRYEKNIPESFTDFNPKEFSDEVCEWVDQLVPRNAKVALSGSGGVDSTALAYTLHPVLGNRLHVYFIDDGLRRIIGGKPEADVTAEMFKDFENFETIQTADKVIPALEGYSSGELKRQIMIDGYLAASNNFLKALGASFVLDGTIKPDIVTKKTRKQRQHNLDLDYNADKIEPLAPLFKPQVRRLGQYAGLPEEFVHKIPCPGPAMLLRVGGRFEKHKLDVVQTANDLFEQSVENHMKKETGKPYKYDPETGIREPFQYFTYIIDPGMHRFGSLDKKYSAIAGSDVECFVTDTKTMFFDPDQEEQKRALYEPILWINSGSPLDYDALWRIVEDASNDYPRVVMQLSEGSEGYPIIMKAVNSSDAMLARSMELPIDMLQEAAGELYNLGISKTGYEISKKPPASIELF